MARRNISNINNEVRHLVRRHRPDYQIILYVGILLLLGLVVLYALSPASAGSASSQASFMQRQLSYLALSIFTFGVVAAVPLNWWQKYAGKILIIALLSCVVLAFLGAVGSHAVLCTYGACRWFNFGFASFQPAEFVKFSLLLFTAGFLGRRIQQGKVNSISDTIFPLGIVVGLATLFIVGFQNDMGSGIAMLGIIAVMAFVAGINKRIGLLALGALLVVGIGFILMAPHRLARVETFFNQSGGSSADSSGYHIRQAKIALGTGGLLGLGLGKSVQAYGYLPEAINDSIFAIMGEIFGFVGLLALIVLFVALLMRLLRIMDYVESPTMRMIVAGTFGWIGTHTIVNIGAMIGVFPLTGITLPLLSFGGTSLIFIMAALGLVFQISRYTTHIRFDEGKTHENTDSRRRIGRSRNANRRYYQGA